MFARGLGRDRILERRQFATGDERFLQILDALLGLGFGKRDRLAGAVSEHGRNLLGCPSRWTKSPALKSPAAEAATVEATVGVVERRDLAASALAIQRKRNAFLGHRIRCVEQYTLL